MRRPLPLVALLALIVTAAACRDGGAADPPPTPALDATTLSQSWPCGRGFHQSNIEQTAALMLDLSDPTWQVPPEQIVTLPDDGWDARVVLGQDLFANWCDDVIEANDPEPRVDSAWPVVAGTIRFADDVATLDVSCAQPVVAVLEGIVVEAPDGTRVPLADRDVRNTCWGGAAG